MLDVRARSIVHDLRCRLDVALTDRVALLSNCGFSINKFGVDPAIVMSRSGLLRPSEILERILGVHQLLKAALVACVSLQPARSTSGNRQRQAPLLCGPSSIICIECSDCMVPPRVCLCSSLPLVGCRPRLRYYSVVKFLEQRLLLDFLKEQVQRLLLRVRVLVQCWL